MCWHDVWVVIQAVQQLNILGAKCLKKLGQGVLSSLKLFLSIFP